MEPSALDPVDPTDPRPDAAAWRAFTVRLLDAAGVGALGAGVIFFVAANWQDYGVLGRFAILEVAFAVCVGLALWRPPPGKLGPAALVLATLVAGTLLALFGQSYQTGADLYELFFTWAALTLPFALAGRSGAVWATWWVVMNIGLALYCGLQRADGLLSLVFDRWRVERSVPMLAAAFIDLAGAAGALYLARTRFAGHAPHWLARMLATMGFLFGTAACVVAINVGSVFSSRGVVMTHEGAAVVAIFAVACVAIGIVTVRKRIDVFPMALIAASGIAVSTTYLAVSMGSFDIGIFFVVSAWLIATSTAAGFQLMRWVRAWRQD